MMSSKKVIICFVEGLSDKFYIWSIAKVLGITKQYILEAIPVKDLTSDFKTKTNNIKPILMQSIKKVMRQNAYKWNDIERIIHVCDLDGAFIPPQYIIKDDEKWFFYSEENIRCSSVDAVLQRNGHKKKILSVLIGTDQLNGVKYNIYFMSCNIEHVFWGKDCLNIDKERKKRLSEAFAQNEEDFGRVLTATIFNANIGMRGYDSSWGDIQLGGNSLKRKTNLNLFYEEYINLSEKADDKLNSVE